MTDPRTSQPTSFPDEPTQPRPGLEVDMRTKPDHGEESYVGKALMTDRAALVTGGDSGIGRAVAIAFAREGADVAISYLEDEQADAEETKAWVEKAGRRCLLLPGDIRDTSHCRDLVERTVAAFGRLDVLVNNAAAQTMNEGLDDIDEASVECAFRANVFAQIWLAQAAAKHMKPGGAIVNTCSIQGGLLLLVKVALDHPEADLAALLRIVFLSKVGPQLRALGVYRRWLWLEALYRHETDTFLASKAGRDPRARWRSDRPTKNQTYLAAEISRLLQIVAPTFRDRGAAHDWIKARAGNPRFWQPPEAIDLFQVAVRPA